MRRSRFVAPKRVESFEDVRKALARLQETLDAGQPKRAALITKDTTLRAGESVRISPRGGATLYAKLPKASAENFGETISILLERPAGTLRVSAQAPDTVVGASATNYTTAGLIVLQSNGVDAWVSAAELPSTSPFANPTWADVLANGDTSGASNPTLDAGQGLVVAGGQSAGAGDIRSAADISLDAATDIHMHADGNIHVGHAGTTQEIHEEAGTIELLTDVNGVNISAATTANITAGASSTIQTATFFAVNATGAVDLAAGSTGEFTAATSMVVTGGGNGLSASAAAFSMAAGTTGVLGFASGALQLRAAGTAWFTVGTAGGWAIGGNEGSAGQYQRSGGAGAPPTWATIALGDIPGIVATTGAVTIAAGGGASTFSGIRDNGSLEIARTHLNFVSTAFDTTFSLTQDAGNDEIEVRVSTLGSFYSENSVGSIQTKFISYDDSSRILATVVDNTGGSGYVNISFDVNQAATFTWTGGHSWNTAGDFDVTAAIVGLNSSSSFGVTAGADATIQADGQVVLTGDEVRIQSNATGGFLTFDAGSASTPGLSANEGMFWVLDPGSPPTAPMFTTDANIDQQLGYAKTNVETNSSTGALGTVAIADGTTVWRWGGGAGDATVAGFSGNLWDGRELWVQNIDGTDGDILTLLPEQAATAGNGIMLPGTGATNASSRRMVVQNRGGVLLRYDGTSSRWQPAHPINNVARRVQEFTTAGTSNNVALNDDTEILRVDTGASNWVITGFTGGWDGRKLDVYSASNSAVTGQFSHLTGSSAGNQLVMAGNANFGPVVRCCASFVYDGADAVWRSVAVNAV